ncbi:MAG: Flp family type IVb pilin [Candidatus Dormibacteraeota bacterium]|nr:Flp family type IVb pilin [Candidatus Dormibacteraeota bacterium]
MGKLWWKVRLPRDQRGQGMVEYALILVLVAVVVIVALTALGNQIKGVFNHVANSLGG